MNFLLQTRASRTLLDGSISSAIKSEAATFNSKRVFLLTSSTLRDTTNEIDKIKTSLGPLCAGVMSGKLRQHSPRSDVFSILQEARAHDADMLVAIGGGSLIDAFKMSTLVFSKFQEFEQDYEAAFDKYVHQGGFFDPSHYEIQDSVHKVAVPTTLSGGEHTFIAGISKEESDGTMLKQAFVNNVNQPKTVVLNSDICRHTPRIFWDSTGVRVIDHCVEAIFSINGNYYFQAEALAALRLIRDGLVQKNAMKSLIAAKIATTLVANGCEFGASHGISHALGAVAEVPHGITSCLLLPAVMKFNKPVINREKYKLIAEAMKFKSAETCIEEMVEFIRKLNLPVSCKEYGVSKEDKEKVAELSLGWHWVSTNPRKIQEAGDVMEILGFGE